MFGFWKKKSKASPAPAAVPVMAPPPLNEPFLGLAPDPMAPETGAIALPPPVGYSLDASLLSDIGCTRQVNQDSGRIFLGSPKGVLIAVADGMGGHKGGEVASQLAIEVLGRTFFDGNSDPQSDLHRAFLEANAAIYQESQQHAELQGMGTTCTALVIRSGVAYATHVGDSRLYMVRGGDIYLMTEDHSAVMELVRQGTLTLAEARHHADKNVITRALGSRPEVEPSHWNEPLPVRIGDKFIICSDGLYDRMEDSEIRSVVLSKTSADACVTLIELAKQRGGYDNITVAVVGLEAVSEEAKAPPETREMEVQL
jgi:serine/threonine protein phosphatase PrpC